MLLPSISLARISTMRSMLSASLPIAASHSAVSCAVSAVRVMLTAVSTGKRPTSDCRRTPSAVRSNAFGRSISFSELRKRMSSTIHSPDSAAWMDGGSTMAPVTNVICVMSCVWSDAVSMPTERSLTLRNAVNGI